MATTDTRQAASRAAATIDAATIRAITQGEHGDPFSVLGLHGDVLRAFLPDAERLDVLDAAGKPLGELWRIDDAGLFEGKVHGLSRGAPYRFEVTYPQGAVTLDDPYRFGTVWGEMDSHLFAEGRHLRLYEKLGAHPMSLDGVQGTYFAVWAPNARRASIVGDFNMWDGRRHAMRKRIECGVFELFVPGVGKGAVYKFELTGPSGERLPLKADPFAFRAQHPPENASVVHGLVEHDWRDEAYMKARADRQWLAAPVATYEVHLGSWMRVTEDGNRYLSYAELADKLVPYCLDMGFTHLELLPVSEYPFDGSWGYQPTGLFAPTIRHGTAEEFAAFVDACHAAGIGVIVDWVPGHFPTDAHGLAQFDGTALFEHADPRQGFHQDWNTLIYNYGRNEVRNFLVCNALYWLDRFHIDGIRVDAVASMLYLDYSRKADEWVPNKFGGRENIDAIEFLKDMNEKAYGNHPGIMTIAEESTAWPAVSRPTYLGGLGFGFKWNMGWMHDTLNYVSREPLYRKYHQNDLTFGLLYAFSENFVLPISHDEVVHGKGSLINKMPGDHWQKAANLRAYLGFMWTHPGKKLLFMGCEFGQHREWAYMQSLDWHLLDDPAHKGVQSAVRDLNRIYKDVAALHALDCSSDGFRWIDASDSEQSVVSFLRRDGQGGEAVVVCNFTPVPRHGYRVGVPRSGRWNEVFNSDASHYGGSGMGNGGAVDASDEAWHGLDASLTLTLPPLSTTVLVPA
ncbi:MAG: 1,4-alpha-glucan branching protein GlgB [Geminicoccaceae bacterium]|nr:1,4-alpha-glucan branching protein GlgB [Geminicoccaceae bacterium]